MKKVTDQPGTVNKKIVKFFYIGTKTKIFKNNFIYLPRKNLALPKASVIL